MKLIIDKKIMTDPLNYDAEEIINRLLEKNNLPDLDFLELEGYEVNIWEHPFHHSIHIKVWEEETDE